ncbi:MAG: hypothetical protein ACP5N2_03050 [Candidatus Nanoarchaeia archaeon]
MSKKGQAAIEFMTTYGWAIMLTLAALAALYLIMINPRDVIPDSCSFGDSFECKDWQINTDGTVKLALKNLVGQTISITSTICVESTNKKTTSETLSVGPGGEFELTCVFDNVQFSEKVKVDFTVVYVKEGYSYPSSADAIVIANPSDS